MGCSSAETRAVLFQYTAVHYHENPCLAGFLRGCLIDHVFLQPDRFHLELHGLRDNSSNVSRPPEHIYQVTRVRHLEQRRIGLLSERFIHLGIDRNDAIALALHIGGYTVAGSQRTIGEPDDGDGSGTLEEIGNWIGLRQGSHSIPQTL